MDSSRPKPRCQLREQGSIYTILFRVRDTLKSAGEDDAAEEFLEEARACRTVEDLICLASSYVDFQ